MKREIKMTVAGGVKRLERGQLMERPAPSCWPIRGVWLSLQPFLDDEPVDPIRFAEGSINPAKRLRKSIPIEV